MNMTFEGTTAIVPHIKSGEVRALAVTSPVRIPEIPDVPTMDELGYPGMPPDSWQAIVAPAGTPPDIVAKINGRERRLGDAGTAKQAQAPWRRAAAEVGRGIWRLHRRSI